VGRRREVLPVIEEREGGREGGMEELFTYMYLSIYLGLCESSVVSQSVGV